MFSERQQQILEIFLQQAEKHWSIGDLLPYFEVGRTSLFRDLSAMGELGLIQADSATRARTYQLNKQSAAYLEWDLSRPPYQRPEVRYNPKLLDHYRPNESYLLTAEQRAL